MNTIDTRNIRDLAEQAARRTANLPRIGDYIKSERLGHCTIIAVHPAGTIDVQAKDGRCYRISGLGFL